MNEIVTTSISEKTMSKVYILADAAKYDVDNKALIYRP